MGIEERKERGEREGWGERGEEGVGREGRGRGVKGGKRMGRDGLGERRGRWRCAEGVEGALHERNMFHITHSFLVWSKAEQL